MEEPDLNQVCLTPSQELFLLDCRIMVAWWTPLGLRDLRTKFPYIFSSCQSSQPSLTPSLHMTYTSDAFYWMRINHLPSFYINYTSISKRKKGKKKRQEGSELPDVQVDLEKAEEPDIKLPTSDGSLKKQESSRINIYFCFIDYAKLLTVWITINCGKFWKRWKFQITWPASWETCVQVRKQQLELDMEQ